MAKQFTRRTEDFTCEVCGTLVKGNGYTNHCPICLSSKHVDVNPGDRASTCQGIMDATGLEIKNGGYVITQTCRKCGHIRKNKSAPNDASKALRALSNGEIRRYIQTIKKGA